MNLHEFIASNREAILATCKSKLKGLSPQLRDEDVLSSMGETLDDVLLALLGDERGEGSGAQQKSSSAGTTRGRQRHALGVGISTVALDFGTLCDAIYTEAVAKGNVCSPRDSQVLNLTLDAGIAAAVDEYWAQASAEQDHAAGERLGVLVHELRNALGSATMAFAVIQQGQVGVQSKTGAVLARGLGRMRELVEQTLAAVKLQAGVVLELRNVRLVYLLRDVEAAVVPERGIRISVEAADDVELDGDPVLLFSAVSNLVGNAVKFTGDGSTIVVRAKLAGDRAIVEVEDRCGGLPPGRGQDLFAPFVQGGQDRRGVGLGLSIVRDVVEAHHGEVGVRDMPGVGCVFSMSLPLHHRRKAAGAAGVS